MAQRLMVENPFYDNDASGSAFGWDFQVNAAIFLFLKYLNDIEIIKVEGKYQDIELTLKNGRHIYAQAKSIQDGSLTHRYEKLEDAIISLAKTPAQPNDSLLYISNYSAPLKDDHVFRNSVSNLKNEKQEQEVFKKYIDKILEKLTDFIDKNPKHKKSDYLMS